MVLRLHIQPRTSRTHIAGVHSNEIKDAITAPPMNNQANSYLIRFLVKEFDVAKSYFVLKKGEVGRYKQIWIDRLR